MNTAERQEQGRQSEYRLLLVCLAIGFGWGLLAHGPAVLHGVIAHDTLAEFDAAVFGNHWQIQLGRVMVPVYRAIFRTAVTLPWLIGVLTLLWAGLAVYLVARIFRLQGHWLALTLVGGVMLTNVTCTVLISTYATCMDQNLFACLLAVLAVFLWQRAGRWDLVRGAVCVGLALGLYQSFVSVTIGLVMMVLILALLGGQSFAEAMRRGLRAVGMLLGGGVLYLGLLCLMLALTGEQLTNTQNSVAMAFSGGSALEFCKLLGSTWVASCKTMVCMPTAFTAFSDVTVFYPGRLLRMAAMLIAAGVLLAGMLDRRLGWKEKLLMAVLAFLMPIGLNVAHVLAHGVSHALMYYALWLIQPFALLLALWLAQRGGPHQNPKVRRWIRLVPVVVLCGILLDNVQVANLAHQDNQMRMDATNALYNRVLARMESVPEYEPGQTPVVIQGRGDRQLLLPDAFEPVRNMTMQANPVISVDKPQFLGPYFRYILQVPMVLDTEHWQQVQTSAAMQQMPCYPDPGSVQMVEGTLLVKLGDRE